MSLKFSAKTNQYDGNAMLNICDADLLGSTVREGSRVMRISRGYYGGATVGRGEAENLLRASSIINMAGANVIELADSIGVGKKSGAKTVGGVPFLIVFNA